MLKLIHGNNIFESQKRLQELTAPLKGAVNYVDAEDLRDVNEIFASTDSLAMFTSTRLTVVKRFFRNRSRISLEKKLVAKLMEKEASGLELIFWEGHSVGARSNKRKKLTKPKKKPSSSELTLSKFIAEHGEIESFPLLTENQCLIWLEQQLDKSGIKNGRMFARKILAICGFDQMILQSEIAKLHMHLHVQGRDSMLKEDLGILSYYEQESKVWELTDAFCSKQKLNAISIMDSLLREPESYPLVFAVIMKQLMLVYLAKHYGQNKERFVQMLGLAPYAYSKAMSFSRGFSEAQIKTLISKLVNLDYSVKQGKIDVKLGLDLLVATL